MSKKMVQCKTCGAEIAKSAKTCPSCGAKNKKKPFGIILVLIGLLIIVGALGNGEESSTTPDKEAESVVSKEESSSDTESVISRESIEELKISASYKDLLRNPDEYRDEYVVITVQIRQILKSGSKTYYFGYTDESGYNFYFDDQYGFVDKRIDDNTKLLEEDILRVYGRFSGLKSFKRALTNVEVEIPCIEILYADIIEETQTENLPNTPSTSDAQQSTIDISTISPEMKESQEKAEKEDASTMTSGQKNALGSAKTYLAFSAFSYDGLIAQLEFEQYSTEDATFAADNCGADWNEQALKSAKNYLNFSAFSYSGLINQLEFEHFTAEQAKYGADHCGADWNEQAVKSAKNYLTFSSFSHDGLIDQLEFEGFTHEQAVYGVEANGY